MEEIKDKKGVSFKRIIISFVLVMGLLFWSYFMYRLGTHQDTDNDSNNYSYSFSIKYTSINYDENSTYVYFDVRSNGMIIYAGDFSVKINNLPIQANYIYDGFWVGNLEVQSQTIRIRFERKISTLDTPITFYYKGTPLELGKEVYF